MEQFTRITSFNTDHRTVTPGMYVSRIDGDVVTYDLRMRKPNSGELLSNAQMHSIEHLIATFLRNSNLGNRVIYFGPMGCQTGFYLLMRGPFEDTLELVKSVFKDASEYDGEIFGKSEIECGNYRNLNVEEAVEECSSFYELIKNKSVKDLEYPDHSNANLVSGF